MNWRTGCIVLILLFIIHNVVAILTIKQKDAQTKHLKDEFKTKYLQQEQLLKVSELERCTYADSIGKLNLRLEVLYDINDTYETEIKSVRGKYNALTSSAKANEMINRANGK